jgi:hypothetical protein
MTGCLGVLLMFKIESLKERQVSELKAFKAAV